MTNSFKGIFKQTAIGVAGAFVLSGAFAAEVSFAQSATVREIKMAAKPLETALNDLARHIGKQIVLYTTDAQGLTAPALKGNYTEEQALKALLKNTGLVYRYINDRTIAVAPPARFAVKPIKVSAYRNGEEIFEADPVEKEEDADDTIMEDIVVTMQKREESLQDVPLSISAFSASMLEAYNIDSIRDISRLTPNFLGSSFTSARPIFAIRGGANTLSAIGTSEPVGIYIDEVYIPRFSAADLELFDLERVEVLRGPQGTFFGRNVASGAVVLTTQKPSLDEFIGKFEASYGNYNAYKVRGLISGPLSDTLAAKISFSRVERDGYGFDVLAGVSEDDMERTSVRAALRWQPSERFEAIMAADYSSDGNGGRTLSAVDFGDDDRRTSHLGVDQDFDREIFGASLRMTYEFDSGSLVSITGLRKSRSDELFTFNGLSYTLLPFAFQQIDMDHEEPRTISQELRFVSDDYEKFNFIAGLFYLNEDSDRIVNRQRLLNGAGVVILDQRYDQNIRTNAIAGYFDGTFHITDKIDISGGLRYTHENQKAILDFTDNNNPGDSFLTEGLGANFDALTPRVALVYRPTEDVTFFGSVSRGFTAGGFNTEADDLNEITTPFQEETILSYEIGAKTRISGGRGYANITLFHQNYDDKQEFVFNPLTFVGTILNAGQATIKGVEIELGWRFNEYLGFNANYGYLDTEFDSFPIGDGPGNTGNELGSSPNSQFSISGDGRYPVLGGRAEIFANASFSWTDGYFTGATNDPGLFIESYGLLGASIGVESTDGQWGVELWASNLLNKEFVLIPSVFIVDAEYLGAPRFYGVRVSLSY